MPEGSSQLEICPSIHEKGKHKHEKWLWENEDRDANETTRYRVVRTQLCIHFNINAPVQQKGYGYTIHHNRRIGRIG